MSVHDYAARTIDGRDQALSEYRGKVLLIVNVASKCGFTPQYEGLEALYRTFQAQGLEVLGFPCDQFGHQEPGSEAEIAEFCSTRFSVTFPMFAKVEVNGDATHPLYQFLKTEKPGVFGTPGIKWNFTKFLVDQQGTVVARYGSNTAPAAIESDIAALLARR